jgi:Bacterial SH3 domain
MTAASGSSLKRLRGRGIIGALLGASLLLASGCSVGGGAAGKPPGRASDATIVRTPTPTASTAAPAAVWVLTPVGLRIHSDHDTGSQTLTTAARGVQLDVLGAATAGDGAWLRVRGHQGTTEGWVRDDPDLVTRRAMTFYSDSANGWSMLFPADWQAQTGNPATFTGGSQKLTVQFAADSASLLPVPGGPGHAVRDEGPVEAYGVTVFFTVYQLDKGGFEYDVHVRVSPSKVYGFQMADAASAADTSLFRQMLDSTVLS